MARLARLYAPGIPQLVQARLAHPLAAAHDPTPATVLDMIQGCLAAEMQTRALALHGWAILLDRIMLLATPDQPHALPGLMQGLGRRMTARIMHGRVFHERYRSTLAQDAWVPACLVWMESSPVRFGLASSPAGWPWSSALEHLGQRTDTGLLTDHSNYWALGNTPFARQARHDELLRAGMTAPDMQRIEQALRGQWALGDAAFAQQLAAKGSRRAVPAPRGRPRKSDDKNTVTN